MTTCLTTIHPERIAACFRSVKSSALAAQLLNEPRFVTRLADLVGRRHQLEDLAVGGWDQADDLIAELDLEGLDRLCLNAGAAFRAHVFVREIRGSVLAALGERFGPEVLRVARAHHDLAGDHSAMLDPDELEIRVREEGRACLAAWIASCPEPLSRRVRLKWSDDAAVPVTSDPDLIARGPVILRRLVLDAEASA